METYRHGDIQLVKVTKLPNDVKSLGKRKELAYGEVTGHAHRIELSELFETKNGVLYLKVEKQDNLTHEEHVKSPVKPGIYRVGIKRQYLADGGWSKVAD